MTERERLENKAFFVAEDLAFVFEKNPNYVMVIYNLNNTKKYAAFYLRNNKFLLYTSTMGQLSMYKSMLYVERNNDFFLGELKKWVNTLNIK